MQKKLVVLYLCVLLAFAGLSARLILINRDNGEQYEKQVLSQQQYSSRTIPFKRGEITDRKGTKLAVSEKVYNLILDCKLMNEKEEYVDATISALTQCFDVDEGEIRRYNEANPDSQYYVLAKQLTYDEIAPFQELESDEETGKYIQGVWFEEEYRRVYPLGTLASDVIGFTSSDNVGNYGLEEYYNDILSGTNGREYGYMNDDANLERTTKAAVDGNNLVSTIDVNIQSIVEDKLREFNDTYKDAVREGNGARNVGCIIMDVDSGEVLSMASYPNFDLNDPRNTDALIGQNMVDADGTVLSDVINEAALETMDDETLYRQLNYLWRNYCISNTYEPGSTMKPFTAAAGLESGALTGNETYECTGSLTVVAGEKPIKCHNVYGDGILTISQAIERSCNVALMKMGQTMGKTTLLKYMQEFNFGLKTNVDLAGEARTASLVFTEDTMGPTELATSTFGQGFNVTMIQMITGFCSLINGGYYYEPHLVSQITSSDGSVVRNIEPRLLKQVISEETSAKIRDYCLQVVIGEKGTGHTARPAGYLIGGKTGTAETQPRGNDEYVVSFMGYAPADDPEIAIYVVVDRPNAETQDDAKFATRIVRSILTEVLPYLDIFMTEPLSEEEQQELEEAQIAYQQALVSGNDVSENDAAGSDAADDTAGTEGGGTEDGGASAGEGSAGADTGPDTGPDGSGTEGEEDNGGYTRDDIEIDPETGEGVLPDGTRVDPETGQPIGNTELNLPEPNLPLDEPDEEDSPF
ncbi:MAG TPA: penicillin-binding protein 2 [Candidatus Eisenbergiella merdipullorum]|uniref:Penicillin-binding protein 2 n=1 Tax=Candidatus Eisenbergiella merdipullorum TaxID=2838553 RepID=A0A9D2IA83_9FIRM|nr:penicillin-binding protein 2 [Candidatus Eisenbergiella merdipullorum]